ncbi:hypothetical protein GGTG_07287 [Gaeumannomyces tritici R3-111a-1]|uniref:Rhodopsin domain-containing protein n=1 Tax=Gaeumannomyces tritici (strain R3-111a-1) TaxID=644352 RepID=J3P190_GAET3|nr:hypothetical protein GGTG_07287 [Gaeumannomyces tritici R3-111a-1]EJT77375.1 hypothetical protein GGTG_07287 [Gaeumannomyces tritici R3-111a-1]
MLAVPAYALSTVLTKCAICVYFFRLTISREVRIIAYATMALAAGQCLTLSVNTITCAASTKNLSSTLFAQSDPDGYPACAKTSLVWVITAFVNSFTDLVLLVLPLWILQPLRAPWRKKLVVMGVLMGGGLQHIQRVDLGGALVVSRNADLSVLDVMLQRADAEPLSSNVELLFGLICACLPAAKAPFNHVQKAKRSSTSFRQIKLRTLTQPAPGALPSQGALGGGGVVRLGSSDPTTAYKESNFTAKHSNSHNHNSSIHGFEPG